MSAVVAKPFGWPEHYAPEPDISPEEFLAQIAAGEDKARPEDAVDAPWLDIQAWTHPGPVAEAFFSDDAKVIALRGPVGSGKTTANLRSRFRRAIMMPVSVIDGVRRYKVVIARATYRQLWQTTIPSWWEVMPKKIGVWSGGRGDPVTHRIEWEDQYGPIEFIAEFLAFGESPAEVNANMRGVQTTDLLLEEADTCPVTVLTVGSGRINRYPQKRHFEGYANDNRNYGQISATYNATDFENWTVRTLEGEGLEHDPAAKKLREALEEKGIVIRFRRQPGYGEPGVENLKNLGDSYYETQIAVMTAAGQTDDIERLVHNRNSYVVEGDPVFKRDFNPSIHVAPAPLKPWPGVPLMLGLDQGLFGAAVICQFMPPYRWQVLGEFWRPHRMLSEEFGDALAAHLEEHFPGLPVRMAFGDMAGENDTGAMGENAVWNRVVGERLGVYIHPQTFGGNRIQPRLSAIRAGLANSTPTTEGRQPNLYISPTCHLLIRGFRAQYVWKDEVSSTGEKVKKPDKSKRAADVMDGLAYVMLSQSPVEGMPPVNSNRNPNARHNGGPPLEDEAAEGTYDYDPLNREDAA